MINYGRPSRTPLLVQARIDHRVTSHDHPQSNGQAENTVKSVKRALRRMCDEKADQWLKHLPWVLLGLRCSVQASTIIIIIVSVQQ